jgi:hypothetical protein
MKEKWLWFVKNCPGICEKESEINTKPIIRFHPEKTSFVFINGGVSFY